MKKVMMLSRYGSKNIGDELIVREIEKLVEEYSIIKFRYSFNLKQYNSINESFAQINHTIGRKEDNVIEKIYRKYVRKNFLISKIRNLLNKGRASKNTNMVNYREKLKDVDALVIGGGNAIYDTEKFSSSAFYFGLILREAKKLGIPIFVINIGVGPFRTKKQLKAALETLDMADYITVRDKKSFDLIRELNIKEEKLFQTVDPVLFLPNTKEKKQKNIDAIGICVMDIRLADYSEEQYKGYIQSLQSLLIYLLENTDYKITVFCTEKDDIYALNDLENNVIFKNIENLSFEKNADIHSVTDIYKNIDLLLGTRMHSTIIAFSQEIPFIGINWQQKVEGFFEVINYQKNLLDINDFIIDYKKAIYKLNEVTQNLKLEHEYLIEQKERLYPLYEINKELLKRVCKE